MTIETPKQKFLRFCPGGFSDPLYFKYERDYKVAAHNMWCDLLCEVEYDRLLEEEQYKEICKRVHRIEAKTKFMLSRYEKAALHDAAKTETSAKLFAIVLYDLVYGDDAFQTRFEEFTEDLGRLHRNETNPVKWTIATMFPFLAHPKEHIFLKPTVTQSAAQLRRFSLNYKPEPNWMTYSCLLRFAQAIAEEVADLNPRDMIDIQSYIWVSEFWKKAP